MKSSSSSKLLLPQTPKITGVPGQIFGTVPVALSGGTLTIKLTERFLQAQVESFFGLETKEIWVPLEDVKAVEIGEGCTWPLFWIGIPLLSFFFIGVVPIVLAFIVKQRWFIIYSSRANLILLYKKSERVEQFKSAVLEACQSRAIAAVPKPPMPPVPPRPKTEG